jgi:hypothetical protein
LLPTVANLCLCYANLGRFAQARSADEAKTAQAHLRPGLRSKRKPLSAQAHLRSSVDLLPTVANLCLRKRTYGRLSAQAHLRPGLRSKNRRSKDRVVCFCYANLGKPGQTWAKGHKGAKQAKTLILCSLRSQTYVFATQTWAEGVCGAHLAPKGSKGAKHANLGTTEACLQGPEGGQRQVCEVKSF